jgi:ERCC4-type nuclease
VLVVDTREQTPLTFCHLPAIAGTLGSGDYSIRGWEERFAIERKSLSDLAGSLTRERDRFGRECHRLRGFDFSRLLVVGDASDLGRVCKADPRSLLSSLSAFEVRYSLPVVWCPCPTSAALLVERWAWFYWREAVRPLGPVPSCPLPLPA